jgi:hypothetical protein
MRHLLVIDGPPGCKKWEHAEQVARRLRAPIINPRYRPMRFVMDRASCLLSGWKWPEVRSWLMKSMEHRCDFPFLPSDGPIGVAVEDELTTLVWARASITVAKKRYMEENGRGEEDLDTRALLNDMVSDLDRIITEVNAASDQKRADNVRVHRIYLHPGSEDVEDRIFYWAGALRPAVEWPERLVLSLAAELEAEYLEHGHNLNAANLYETGKLGRSSDCVITEIVDTFESMKAKEESLHN